jgi:hypothetical protein
MECIQWLLWTGRARIGLRTVRGQLSSTLKNWQSQGMAQMALKYLSILRGSENNDPQPIPRFLP